MNQAIKAKRMVSRTIIVVTVVKRLLDCCPKRRKSQLFLFAMFNSRFVNQRVNVCKGELLAESDGYVVGIESHLSYQGYQFAGCAQAGVLHYAETWDVINNRVAPHLFV